MDLRKSLNAVSDVMMNRPPPLREFDQIYMKAADMLIQAEHITKWVSGKSVVFVGDGDAIAPLLVHLAGMEIVERGPERVHVLDFDERIVNAVNRFSQRYGYGDTLTSSLYNVAYALPEAHRRRYHAYYTNPPFGGSNHGASVKAFFARGMEALVDGGLCCAAIADYADLPWCDEVLHVAQAQLIEHGFVIAEMVPRFHHYHLEDEPDLTSCSLIGRHVPARGHLPTGSAPLAEETRRNFYGRDAQLTVEYVRDGTNGGKLASHDYTLVPFPNDEGE